MGRINRLTLPNKRTELVRGVLVVREPAGYVHGDVAARLLLAIGNHVLEHGLGRVFAPETGFTLARKLDTVRAPDVAFISSERLPIRRLGDSPRWHRISPSKCYPQRQPGGGPGKGRRLAESGTHLVWVVDPRHITARVYRADGTESIVGERDALDGEALLPGFSCALASILPMS